MKRTMKRIVSALLALGMAASLLATSAFAAPAGPAEQNTAGTTYYLDSREGDDAAGGTAPDAAWKSLSKIGEITLQPGDRVLLRAGSTFEEGLKLTGSGSAEAPILVDMYEGSVVGAEAGVRPHIKGGGTTTGRIDGADVSYGIWAQNTSHITIRNLEVSNQAPERKLSVGVVVDAYNCGVMQDVHLDNLYVHDVNGTLLEKTIPNGGIYCVVTGYENDTRFHDLSVENCTVKNVSRTGISVGSSRSYALWDGHGGDIPQDVLDKYAHTNMVIRGNYVENAGGDAIVPMFAQSPLIEYNISNGASQNTKGNPGAMYNAGIWPWRCENAVFQFNEAYGTIKNGDGQAYDCDWSDGTIYQYNYSHDNEGGFMLVCQTEVLNSIVRYNISQNDRTSIFLNSNTHNADIYNNTFYIGEGLNTNVVSLDGVMTLKNNIFYNLGTVKKPNWGRSFTYDNNLYYGFDTTPNDPHAIVADPMFVDPGKGGTGVEGDSAIDTLGGYALREGSPAINAGLDIPDNGGRDYAGSPVGDSTPDLGALESSVMDVRVTSDVFEVRQAENQIVIGDEMSVADFRSGLKVAEGTRMSIEKDGQPMAEGTVTDGVKVELHRGELSRSYTVLVDWDYSGLCVSAALNSKTHTASATIEENGVNFPYEPRLDWYGVAIGDPDSKVQKLGSGETLDVSEHKAFHIWCELTPVRGGNAGDPIRSNVLAVGDYMAQWYDVDLKNAGDAFLFEGDAAQTDRNVSWTAAAYNKTVTYLLDGKNGGAVSFTFEGDGVRWIAAKENNMGIARVLVDGKEAARIDVYTEKASTGSQVYEVLYSKTWDKVEKHTIKIEYTGEKNPDAIGANVSLDAFVVINSKNTPAPVLGSDVYEIDQENSVIWLEQPEEYSQFVSQLATADEYLVTFEVQKDGKPVSEGTVDDSCTVVVRSGEQERTYTIAMEQIPLSYNYADDFVGGAQGPVWYHEYIQDGQVHQFTDWRAEWNCWVALSERLTAGVEKEMGLIAPTNGAQTSFTWVAPRSGVVEIGQEHLSWLRRDWQTSGNIGITVTHNGETVAEEVLIQAQSEMVLRPFQRKVEKGDRISFTASFKNNLTDPSAYFTPTVSYVDEVQHNAAVLDGTLTASSTASGYAVKGLADGNVSARQTAHEWKAEAAGGQWLNLAFGQPQRVTGILFASAKSAPLTGDVKLSFSEGNSITLPASQLASAAGYVVIPLPEARTTEFVKVEFVNAESAPALGEMQVLAGVDLSALQAAYNENKDKQQEDYTPENWVVFAAARDTAAAVLADPAATQQDVDDAAGRLANAAGSMQRLYAVTVVGGTAGVQKAKEGDTVHITAEVPEGKQFVRWESGQVSFANASKAETSFVMPASAVAVTAVLEDKPQPTAEPTAKPTATPAPTAEPTAKPTATPAPTAEPTAKPTAAPAPTAEPTAKPTATPAPTAEPTAKPTAAPTAQPTEAPQPSPDASAQPTAAPTQAPADTGSSALPATGDAMPLAIVGLLLTAAAGAALALARRRG